MVAPSLVTERSPRYAWVILAATMIIVGLAMGSLFSLGVFLKPIQSATGWSRTGISTVALWAWLALGVGSFLWGTLSDRWGARPVVVAGGSLLGLGLVLSSRATELAWFSATFGGLVGLAVGAFYAPLTSTVTRWFAAKRGLAVALVSAGSGIGTFLIAPLVRWLIDVFDWRTAMLLLGDLVWLAIVPLAFLLRPLPAARVAGADVSVARDFTLAEVWRAPQFWLIALTHFTCCLAHSGPIFHMIAHATDQGVGPAVAATVFGVSGLSSIAGRVGSGLVADRIGAKATLLAMLALQAPAIFLYLFTRGTGSFYLLAIVFGIGYGGVMPLYALLTREYFGATAMGGAYGAVFMLQAVGMGLGAFAGGWFFDVLGTYAWLFITASIAGAVAVLFALPLRAPRVIPAPVAVAAG
jgi:MFS family permease